MKKLLVTGASGFLGWYLCQQAQADWTVVGTYRDRPFAQTGVTPFALDLTDFQALKQAIQTLQPDAVIHAAAQAKPNLCETHPEDAYRINVTASCNLAGLCADAAIPCVFVSTDLVFNGLNPPYREGDPVSPINRYGEQKVAAEQGMRVHYSAVTICRMPLMFGAAPVPSFIQPFLQTLRSGQDLKLFIDEFRTPVSGAIAAKGILLALETGQALLHLGGRERLSRYQFGELMAAVWDLPKHQIVPCQQAEVPMAASRPPDVSMDSSLAFSLGYSPGELRDQLRALVEAI